MQRVRIMASQLSQLLVITENLYGNDTGRVCVLHFYGPGLFVYMKISLVNYANTYTGAHRGSKSILFASNRGEKIDSRSS